MKLPSDRKFGIFFTTIFSITAIYFSHLNSTYLFYGFGFASIVFLSITLIHAELLNPLNRLWMSFGFFLGKIVSPIIMGIIFFGIFTPISLLMRLIRRDELRLKFKTKKTYWRDRHPSNDINHSFKNQF